MVSKSVQQVNTSAFDSQQVLQVWVLSQTNLSLVNKLSFRLVPSEIGDFIVISKKSKIKEFLLKFTERLQNEFLRCNKNGGEKSQEKKKKKKKKKQKPTERKEKIKQK